MNTSGRAGDLSPVRPGPFSLSRRMLRTMPMRRLIVVVALASWALLGVDAWHSRGAPPWGPRPATFAVFAGCCLLTEIRPLLWLRHQDYEEVTASWTFMMALLLTGSAMSAAVTAAAAFVLGDLVSRKPADRTLYNASQLIIAISLGSLVIDVSHQTGAISNPHGPGLAWFPVFAIASVVVFATNIGLTSLVIAKHQGQPMLPILRGAVAASLSTDGMLLALSPVLVVVASRSLWLIPLLLVTIWTVYRSAQSALARRHEANHDLLTDLPNRRLFNERLANCVDLARRGNGMVGLILLDLDGFKGINDRLGHHVGDQVLVQVARRFEAARRPSDMLARLGGDEFALILSSLSDVSVAVGVAERLLRLLDEPIMTEGFPVSVGVRLGVAVLPDHAEDSEALLRRADEAMYRAKRGRKGVVVFRPSGTDAVIGRLGLMGDLAAALQTGELYLEYQPQVSLASGLVVGVEALCRWRHPYAGIIGPSTFMPLAEQTELIGLISEWVLREALAQSARWSAQGVELTMAVNVSARDVQNVRFPVLVRRLLDEAGMAAALLNLEITENTAPLDATSSQAVLGELRDMGVTVAVDDFGTGFSSLTQLRDLHFDEIKLDRTFVASMVGDERNYHIVRSILELGSALGLTTVAEGVEDATVVSLLQDLRCDRAQGYLFGAPGPAEAIIERMRRPALLGVPRVLEVPA